MNASPLRPAEIQAADPAFVQLMQKPQRQPTPTNTCVKLLQQHFESSSPEVARNHLAAFKKYVAFKQDMALSIHLMNSNICLH